MYYKLPYNSSSWLEKTLNYLWIKTLFYSQFLLNLARYESYEITTFNWSFDKCLIIHIIHIIFLALNLHFTLIPANFGVYCFFNLSGSCKPSCRMRNESRPFWSYLLSRKCTFLSRPRPHLQLWMLLQILGTNPLLH